MYYYGPQLHVLRPYPLYYKWKSRNGCLRMDLTTIREIVSKYGLELTGNPEWPPDKGAHSHNILVSTSAGKKILKKYKHTVIRPTVMHEHSILTYLAEINFPSPRLVTTRSGKTWVEEREDKYALFDFIENGYKRYTNYILFPWQSRQIITCAGKLVAALHDKLKDVVPQGYNPNGFTSRTDDRWRNVEWYVDKLTQCKVETSRMNTIANRNQAVWLLNKAAHLEEALFQLEVMLNEAGLPRVIIHGDYSPGNLLLRKNEHIVVVDFEMARLDWRATELVDCMWRFGYDRQLGFRINKIKWFLAAYQTSMPLTASELHYVPALWRYVHIRRAIRHWYYYCSTGDDSRLNRACHFLGMVEWIRTNGDKLMSAIGAIRGKR